MLMVIPTTDTDTSKIVKFGFISYYTTQSGMSIQKYAPVSVSLKLAHGESDPKKMCTRTSSFILELEEQNLFWNRNDRQKRRNLWDSLCPVAKQTEPIKECLVG